MEIDGIARTEEHILDFFHYAFAGSCERVDGCNSDVGDVCWGGRKEGWGRWREVDGGWGLPVGDGMYGDGDGGGGGGEMERDGVWGRGKRERKRRKNFEMWNLENEKNGKSIDEDKEKYFFFPSGFYNYFILADINRYVSLINNLECLNKRITLRCVCVCLRVYVS